jgi:type VI secretion system protein
MARGSLLSRLRRRDEASLRHGVADDDLREAVLDNLQALCGACAGSSPACPGYGMVAISDVMHSCPDSLAGVASGLRAAIGRYEPRLANVVVRPLPLEAGVELLLRFSITADLLTPAGKVPVSFTTLVTASRHVTVR